MSFNIKNSSRNCNICDTTFVPKMANHQACSKCWARKKSALVARTKFLWPNFAPAAALAKCDFCEVSGEQCFTCALSKYNKQSKLAYRKYREERSKWVYCKYCEDFAPIKHSSINDACKDCGNFVENLFNNSFPKDAVWPDYMIKVVYEFTIDYNGYCLEIEDENIGKDIWIFQLPNIFTNEDFNDDDSVDFNHPTMRYFELLNIFTDVDTSTYRIKQVKRIISS